MLIAIPTVNNKLITRRFGRMTEITFLEKDEQNNFRQFVEEVTPHPIDHEGHHHGAHQHGMHHHGDAHNDRHDEIVRKLNKADVVIYKSLCKNWQMRLADSPATFKRTDSDLLTEVISALEVEYAV